MERIRQVLPWAALISLLAMAVLIVLAGRLHPRPTHKMTGAMLLDQRTRVPLLSFPPHPLPVSASNSAVRAKVAEKPCLLAK